MHHKISTFRLVFDANSFIFCCYYKSFYWKIPWTSAAFNLEIAIGNYFPTAVS